MRTYHQENDWTEHKMLQKQVNHVKCLNPNINHLSRIFCHLQILKSIFIIWAYTSRRKEES